MIVRMILKTLALFLLWNILYMVFQPPVTRLSVYNTLVPGRTRLPYGENPSASYNVTVTDFDTLLKAHQLDGADQNRDEYRTLLLGDSAVWGWLLRHDQTLSACINRQKRTTVEGRPIQAYNLGYPILNVTKDLLILERSMQYEPDLIVWFVTLEAMYPQEQLFHEIVRAHAERVTGLIEQYALRLDPAQLPPPPTIWERTLIGQRQALAAWLQLQAYGIAWWSTQVDHRNPEFYEPVRRNLRGGEALLDGTQPQDWDTEDLAFDVLRAGLRIADDTPVLLVNEPIYRSSGANSDLRYNFYYPRWAFDTYRELMQQVASAEGWHYVDLWDAVPAPQFTDSSLHMTPQATCQFAQTIGEEIETIANQ